MKMPSYEFTLWDICDVLAGSIDTSRAAREAFIIAADKLAESGVEYWSTSLDYISAKALGD